MSNDQNKATPSVSDTDRPVRVGDMVRSRSWSKTEWPSGHKVTVVTPSGFGRSSQTNIDVQRVDFKHWMHADGTAISESYDYRFESEMCPSDPMPAAQNAVYRQCPRCEAFCDCVIGHRDAATGKVQRTNEAKTPGLGNPDTPSRWRARGIIASARAAHDALDFGGGLEAKIMVALDDLETLVREGMPARCTDKATPPQCKAETTFDGRTRRCWQREGHLGNHEGHEITLEWDNETAQPRPEPKTDDEKLMAHIAQYVDEWRDGDGAWHGAGHIREILRAVHRVDYPLLTDAALDAARAVRIHPRLGVLIEINGGQFWIKGTPEQCSDSPTPGEEK